MLNLNKQRGAAIIVALFVTTIVAVAAIAMIERFRIDLRRTELLQNTEKMQLYAEGSIAWAMAELNKNWLEKKPNTLVDPTPIHSPIDVVDQVEISSIIYDQEGLFNLNNLANPETHEGFIRLVRTVQPEISIEQAKTLADAIRDWVAMGATNTSVDQYYLKQNPAYRAPHRAMFSISELRLVQGITQNLYLGLMPYITALPEVTKININNAPAPVLLSLNKTLTLDAALAIENARKKKFFTDVKSFLQFDIVKNNPIDENKINVVSNYFLVKTSVKVGSQEAIIYTLLHREIKNSKPIEMILWQSKGTL